MFLLCLKGLSVAELQSLFLTSRYSCYSLFYDLRNEGFSALQPFHVFSESSLSVQQVTLLEEIGTEMLNVPGLEFLESLRDLLVQLCKHATAL